MTQGGYAGYFLEVDLTTGEVARSPLPEPYRRQNLGGKALAAQILWDRMTGLETAFSEENPVILAAAPLTGTGAPGSSRFDLASLSPKDGLPVFSNCGGEFGVYLKRAGYDALILKGKATRPFWLEISGQDVLFHDAGMLWGLGTGQCREVLTGSLQSRQFASLCIGPAGEHLVKFASLVADGHSTGRAGLGAIFGWKQLKAITVSGDRPIPIWNREAAAEQNRKWYAQLRQTSREVSGEDFCRGCPIRCFRHKRKEESLLNELGMDAIGAETALTWAADRGMATENLYKAIAFRTGIGDWLADGEDDLKGKGGKRRRGSYGQIAKIFGLNPGEEATGEFCRNFTEAVSSCGQCMFTVNVLQPGMTELPLVNLLESVTGQNWDVDKLLTLGAYSRKLEEQLKERFRK